MLGLHGSYGSDSTWGLTGSTFPWFRVVVWPPRQGSMRG